MSKQTRDDLLQTDEGLRVYHLLHTLERFGPPGTRVPAKQLMAELNCSRSHLDNRIREARHWIEINEDKAIGNQHSVGFYIAVTESDKLMELLKSFMRSMGHAMRFKARISIIKPSQISTAADAQLWAFVLTAQNATRFMMGLERDGRSLLSERSAVDAYDVARSEVKAPGDRDEPRSQALIAARATNHQCSSCGRSGHNKRTCNR